MVRLNTLARIYNWSVPLEHEALRRAVALADVQPSDQALDVATGTGALARALVRIVPGTRVIGIDRSPAMLSGAGCLAARSVVADARELPVADASCDVVFVSYLLHLLNPDERKRVLEATARVLRPGARVVTVTVETRSAVARWLLSRLPRWTGLRPLDPRTELERAGLQPTAAQYASHGWPSLIVRADRVQT